MDVKTFAARNGWTWRTNPDKSVAFMKSLTMITVGYQDLTVTSFQVSVSHPDALLVAPKVQGSHRDLTKKIIASMKSVV